ncbi:MAG TPA: hypothetical protein VFB21_16360 [Chthonomonadaceae bacterium]|nr:hypothetical protein [Chthonomonadaceae bacterium]
MDEAVPARGDSSGAEVLEERRGWLCDQGTVATRYNLRLLYDSGTANVDSPVFSIQPILDLKLPTDRPQTSFELSQGAAASPFPSDLVAEYRILTRKKLLKKLSSEEAVRLESIKSEIAAIDKANPAFQKWRAQSDKIRAELDQIRQEAEAILRTKK